MHPTTNSLMDIKIVDLNSFLRPPPPPQNNFNQR
jgi:hypothetical protein